MSHPAHDTNASTALWAAGGAAGSAFFGLLNLLQSLPGTFYVSLGGVLGSIIVPVVKLRMDSRMATLAAENSLLREERAQLARDRDAFREMALIVARPLPTPEVAPR